MRVEHASRAAVGLREQRVRAAWGRFKNIDELLMNSGDNTALRET